jgi:hypothetical protein
MSKIQETMRLIKAGARSNKYRVLYPVFGNEIDIVCKSTSMPGRTLGTVEVFVKGRKFQLASESADDNTWEIEFYNVPDLLHRRFFLKMIGGVHNHNTPDYLNDGGSIPAPNINSGTNLSVSGSSNNSSASSLASFLGGVSDSVTKINSAYNDLKNLWGSAKKVSNNLKQAINGDWQSLLSLISENGYSSTPWYQQEVIIQQLDNNGQPIAEAVLHNCFVTSVGEIEYSDESGDISTTTVTFSYSGISYGNNSEIPSIEEY